VHLCGKKGLGVYILSIYLIYIAFAGDNRVVKKTRQRVTTVQPLKDCSRGTFTAWLQPVDQNFSIFEVLMMET